MVGLEETQVQDQKSCYRSIFSYRSSSEEDTNLFGEKLMNYILTRNKKIIAFFGDLAAGKTTLIKSMISAYFPIDVSTITSPTFNYLNIYPTSTTIYHFDLYRVDSDKKLQELAIFDYFKEGLCMIEWSEKIKHLLPSDALKVMLFNLSENERQIEVYDCIEKI